MAMDDFTRSSSFKQAVSSRASNRSWACSIVSPQGQSLGPYPELSLLGCADQRRDCFVGAEIDGEPLSRYKQR